MADFYFFTDTDLLNPQLSSQAYGPIESFEDEKYRLCNLHKSSVDSSAYAICNGTVFIQESATDPTLVNLVLKPSVQSDNELPCIKYFIYKGIKKSSLIAIGDTEIASAASNDLTKSIWDSQNAKNESTDISEGNPPGTTTDSPPAQALGVNYKTGASMPYTAADTDSLGIPFYKTDVDFQMPVVSGGTKVGTFDKNGFGLEIIFETIKFSPTMILGRNFDHILDIAKLTGFEPQSEYFNHWNDKEIILSFLDSSAFFGSFYSSKLGVKASTDPDFTFITGDSIYSQALAKFNNRNRVYVDLRGELNHGFNYFGNYGTDVDMSFDDGAPLSLVDLYRANWPILIIDTDFPAGNTSNSNTIRMSFPKGDMEYPLLIAKTARDENSFPSCIKGKYRFIRLEHDDVSTFSLNILDFKVPNFVDVDTTPIASYIHLKYVRSLINSPSITPNDSQLLQMNGFDHLFYPFDMKTEWTSPPGRGTIQIFREEQYVDLSRWVSESFLAFRGIGINEGGGLTLFAYASGKYIGKAKQSNKISLSGSILETGTASMGKIGDVLGVVNIKITHPIGASTIEFEDLDPNVNAFEDQYIRKSTANPYEFFFVNLSSSQMASLEAIKADPGNGLLPKYPISLRFELHESDQTDYGLNYNAYKIYLTGFKLDVVDNEIVRTEVDTGFYYNQLEKRVYSMNIKF